MFNDIESEITKISIQMLIQEILKNFVKKLFEEAALKIIKLSIIILYKIKEHDENTINRLYM